MFYFLFQFFVSLFFIYSIVDIFVHIYSPRKSPWQSAIAEGFDKANSVFIVITLAKILPRWLFHSKRYIQFTIFNAYFLTKLSFTNKRYHLHVLEKCLYVLQEVLWLHIFKQLLFCFILLPFVHLPAPKKNKTCDIKQKLFI